MSISSATGSFVPYNKIVEDDKVLPWSLKEFFIFSFLTRHVQKAAWSDIPYSQLNSYGISKFVRVQK